MIEASITKKGQYSLYRETPDNRLVYLSYKRVGTGILKVHELVEALFYIQMAIGNNETSNGVSKTRVGQ